MSKFCTWWNYVFIYLAYAMEYEEILLLKSDFWDDRGSLDIMWLFDEFILVKFI